MGSFIDLSNKKFNCLTVISKIDYVGANGIKWLCRCDCGNTIEVLGSNLRKNHTKSCGCYKSEKSSKRMKKYNNYNIDGQFGIGYTNKNEEFYFDLEDYNIIKNYCWCKTSNGYLTSYDSNIKKHILMHRLIMNCICNDYIIDHINHNISDNRKKNLRCCSHIENCRNTLNSKNNTSGHKGVYKHSKNNKWIAFIMINKKSIYLGSFDNIEDAINKRNSVELDNFKEFSSLK